MTINISSLANDNAHQELTLEQQKELELLIAVEEKLQHHSDPFQNSGKPRPVQRSTPIKILPLGDSITQGGGGYPSYRRALWFLLKNAGHNVDFIGSERKFIGYVPQKFHDFDLDHEGHWGWEAGEIQQQLPHWVKQYRPDIVLLHLGTNDLANQQPHENITSELTAIIAELRSSNPAVIILLGKIIPMRKIDTASLNQAIHRMGRRLSTEQSPIVIVDHYSGFSPTNDNHDNFHPNLNGEEKMAKRWFYALQPYL